MKLINIEVKHGEPWSNLLILEADIQSVKFEGANKFRREDEPTDVLRFQVNAERDREGNVRLAFNRYYANSPSKYAGMRLRDVEGLYDGAMRVAREQWARFALRDGQLEQQVEFTFKSERELLAVLNGFEYGDVKLWGTVQYEQHKQTNEWFAPRESWSFQLYPNPAEHAKHSRITSLACGQVAIDLFPLAQKYLAGAAEKIKEARKRTIVKLIESLNEQIGHEEALLLQHKEEKSALMLEQSQLG